MFSERKRRIVEYLSQFRNGADIQDLADYFDVSLRTIRNDLDFLQEWLEDHGVTLENRSGKKRWVLHESFHQIRQLMADQLFSDVSYIQSPLERRLWLAFYLIIENRNVNLKEMSEELAVSKSTIVQDLKQLDAWFQYYRLELRTNQKGYVVSGSEEKKRLALLSLIQWFEYEWGDHRVVNQLGWTYLSKDELKRLKSAVDAAFGKISYFSEDYQGIIYKILVIQIQRVRQGASLERPYQWNDEWKMDEKVAQLLEKICVDCGLDFPNQEKWFQMRVLLILATDLFQFPSHFTRQAMNDFISTVLSRVGLIQTNTIMKEQIRKEVEKLYLSAQLDFRLVSPIYQSLTNEYNFLFSPVKKALKIFGKEELNQVQDVYLSGLVMCFASVFEQEYARLKKYKVVVICPSGTATSHLLASRLLKHFTNLDIVGVFSLNAIRQLQQHVNFDFVISTFILDEDEWEHPVITVKPFLDEREVEKIKRFIEGQQKHKSGLTIHEDGVRLLDLLPKSRIYQEECESVEDAMRTGVELLRKDGIVEEGYFDDIYSSYAEKGPYFEIIPGLLFPHASSQHVRKVGLSLVRLRRPIVVKGDREIKAILTLATPDTSSHLPLLQKLHQYLMSTENVEHLLNGGND
ncbi:MAG: PTS sugar transporter subunit IIA [Bacillaceae bacterium]|nr:PTS sugar transporter subunit IIA [Bacillaceae bacterium]